MPRCNKNDNLFDKRVYCPFFKGTEHSQLIRCEGPIPGTTLRVGFTGKAKCAKYMQQYCITRECVKCRVYQCANAKYEEEQGWTGKEWFSGR